MLVRLVLFLVFFSLGFELVLVLISRYLLLLLLSQQLLLLLRNLHLQLLLYLQVLPHLEEPVAVTVMAFRDGWQGGCDSHNAGRSVGCCIEASATAPAGAAVYR